VTGLTIWITGLPAAGKSTIALALAERLGELGRPTSVLDGDVMRAEISADLGFSAADRIEQGRRASALACERALDGSASIVALVSPYRCIRDAARQVHESAGVQFVEVFVDTPLAECERRDPKGLYRRARAGEITGMTGLDDEYEPPAAPEVRTGGASVEEVVTLLVARLPPIARERGVA